MAYEIQVFREIFIAANKINRKLSIDAIPMEIGTKLLPAQELIQIPIFFLTVFPVIVRDNFIPRIAFKTEFIIAIEYFVTDESFDVLNRHMVPIRKPPTSKESQPFLAPILAQRNVVVSGKDVQLPSLLFRNRVHRSKNVLVSTVARKADFEAAARRFLGSHEDELVLVR